LRAVHDLRANEAGLEHGWHSTGRALN
jgi:hypothetical protein